VHRYVLRADFSADMALEFPEDFAAAIGALDNGAGSGSADAPTDRTYGFTH